MMLCISFKLVTYTRSVQQVSSHVVWKIEVFIEEDTKYKKCCTSGNVSVFDSRSIGTSHSSPNHHQLPCCIFQNLITEISSLSKVILVLRKARSSRASNLGCNWSEPTGWFDVSQKKPAWDVMWVCCRDEAANHQLPMAETFWIIWGVSMEGYSSLMQNLMWIHFSTCSVILNALATHHTYFNSIYHPHWLVQWSHHCSACTFQSTLLGWQVTMTPCKPFLLY